MAKQDRILDRIQEFNEAKGGGVLIYKASKGYCLIHEDTGRPVARLRPTSKADQFEVMRRRGDKWGQIGDCPMVMPLEEALAFISRDPIGIFWGW